MGDDIWVNGINLLTIDDELKLHELLDASQDIDDRKKIRGRLKDVMASSRARREEMARRREEDRENAIKNRLKDAEEQKRRTLAMYDAMAKSAPAGGAKTMDINILREGKEGKDSGRSSPAITGPKLDMVEEGLRQRVREADERKRKILAAYDQAAKSGPAGAPKNIDFDNVNVENYDPRANAPKFTSTFQMKGGIPIYDAAKNPYLAYKSQAEVPYDPMEAAIRKRQQEADERKRRTLATYDAAAKSRPAGIPISVYVPVYNNVEPVVEALERPKRGPGSSPGTPNVQSNQQRGPLTQQQLHQDRQYNQNLNVQLRKPAAPPVPSKPVAPPPQQQSYLQQNQQKYRNVANFRPVAPQPVATNNVQSTATVNITRTTGNQQQQQQKVTTTTTTTTRREFYEEDEDEEEEEEEEDDY